MIVTTECANSRRHLNIKKLNFLPLLARAREHTHTHAHKDELVKKYWLFGIRRLFQINSPKNYFKLRSKAFIPYL